MWAYGKRPNNIKFMKRFLTILIFTSLLVTWRYMPYDEQIAAYDKYVKMNYDENLYKIFNAAIELNQADVIVRNQMHEFPFYYLPKECNIVLYGAGVVGQAFVQQIRKKKGINVVCWVDADAKNMGIKGIYEIDEIRSIDNLDYDYVVIAIEKEEIAEEIKISLTSMGVEKKKIFWKNPRLF